MIDFNLNAFDPITLEEMSSVKLMNRIDTKYVTTVSRLTELLAMLSDDYFIQDAEGLRVFPYYTVYFDTSEHRMYMTHLCGKKTRQKVRMRTYVNTGSHFLEIKRKNNKGRTRKKRIPIEAITDSANRFDDFISSHSDYASSQLHRQIENQFDRITLVNRNFTERLTIDTNLRFHNLDNDNSYELPNIAIIELKRNGASSSPVQRHLVKLRIFPSGFSKYCMGMVFTDPAIRKNRFKERARKILKMDRQQSPHQPKPIFS